MFLPKIKIKLSDLNIPMIPWKSFLKLDQPVDFSKTLNEQYNFSNIISDEDNCIFVE